MHSKKYKNAKDKLKKFAMLLLCFLSAYFITAIIVFPKNIKFIEGEKQNFNFRLPLKAVLNNETITTLKVNDIPVTESFELDLYRNNELVAEEAGRTNMTLNAFGIPVKNVSLDFLPNTEIVPCGLTIGVLIQTDGIMVLGTGYVNSSDGETIKPAEGVLKPGDLILKINNEEVSTKEDFQNIIEYSSGDISLLVNRDDEILDLTMTPTESVDERVRKIGVWIRDKTKGIGTITYYNPENMKFGALGHGIVDVDVKKLMSIKEGKIFKANVDNVVKGKKGSPGELEGTIYDSEIVGSVENNNHLGIYGVLDSEDINYFPNESMPIALQNEIHEGPAKIKSNIEGTTIEEFDIYIESVNRYSKDDSKGMVIKITDPRLLDLTNGIVQGMSGSPIIQDEKVIGAITHVFVQDPSKGYGIFIENMLKQEK